MMQSKKIKTLTEIFTAISCMICVVSFSVIFTLHFRALYYFDIKHLDIERKSGYSREEIKENYDAIIDYNSIGSKPELVLPTMPLSHPSSMHFKEVKEIFHMLYYFCIGSFIISLICGMMKWRKREYGFLKVTAIVNIVFPTILGGIIALNWDAFFVSFHKLVFSNDYWIFDPKVDPVILILPEMYFMHCALVTIGVIVISSGLCYVMYRKKIM